MTAIGDIVEYVVTDADVALNGSQIAGVTVPLLVISVNEEDGTYSGTAFTLNGTFNIHVPPDAPAEPETSIDISGSEADIDAVVGKLTDAQRDEMRRALALYPDAQVPVTDPSAPPVTEVPATGGNQ